jgi:hypothetical protein
VQPAGDESHAPVLVPSTVHWAWFAPTGHCGVSQAPAAHVRSHLQALPQSTTSHAFVPEHVTAHFDPAEQSTSLHALGPMQLIVQSHPGGHVTLPQLSALEHSTTQVCAFSSQLVQSSGQLATTQ